MRPNTLVTKILKLSREDPALLQQLEKFRRAVTVMFTDIKGSTEYFESFGDIAGLAMVHECNDLQRSVIEQHGGRVVKTIGDAVMASFDDGDQSVRAAIEIQRRLRDQNAIKKTRDAMLVRMGLHHGMGIVKSDDVFGDVVNVASRVESVAQPTQIVISDSLQQRIAGSQFDVVPLGRFRLRGKSEERELYLVRWSEGESHPVSAPSKTAHTMVTQPAVAGTKLQHLASDGRVSAEYVLTADGVTVGNAESDEKSTDSSNVPAVRARFYLLNGQPVVEDVSNQGRIFIRLIATYTLEEGDIVLMGTQLFKFVWKPELASAATTVGKTIMDVSDLLQEPVAEFWAIDADRSLEMEKYPLRDQEVTFGRTNATYTFDKNRLMSRSHARVYQRGENFFLEDLNSRNGTFIMVRGKAPVPFGASVLLGRLAFRVVQ